jgi:TolA-binding protein
MNDHGRSRRIFGNLALFALIFIGLCSPLAAQTKAPPAPPAGGKPASGSASDIELVERLLAARRDYQGSLERLRAYYLSIGDVERSKWAEEELLQYHRIAKQAYRLELDVPPPTLQASYNDKDANELFIRAMSYKDKGRGLDYIDNQRRAELLLQQLLSNYPQSNKIDDAAYELGDLYESKAYKQYRRATSYFERCFQWNPNTDKDARMRAARIYDKQLHESGKASQLYSEVLTHETDPKRRDEARKRLDELRSK